MIEVSNLTKRYGQHIAVNNISFNIADGEIVGFLGPNGAGKTTTMNMMTGYISSTEGSVVINGFDILDEPEKAKKQIGYLPDTPPVYGDMTVMEYLLFVCDIKHIKRSERQNMIEEVMSIVKVTHVKNRIIKNLSKGYRQRVGLAQALIGFPEVLILDEPTVGLDPTQIIEMRDVIKKLGERHTVILSSHILSEVSAVCDRVIIINKGEIVASDTPERLSDDLTKGHEINIRIKGKKDDIQKAFESSNLIKNIEIQGIKEEGTFDVAVYGDAVDIREEVFNVASKNNLPLLMVKSNTLTLEEIFLQIINGEFKDNVTIDTDIENVSQQEEDNV